MLPEPLIGTLTEAIPVIPALPFCAFLAILISGLAGERRSETVTHVISLGALLGAAGISLGAALLLALDATPPMTVDAGAWFSVGGETFRILFALDAPAVSFGSFSLLVVTLVAVFSRRYVHKEPGFHRFHALLCLFAAGLGAVAYAGDLDVLLVGWEMVGVTSVLLIAFFNHRPMPVRNALRVFSTYRICDMGLILAALCLHASHHTAPAAGDAALFWRTLGDGPMNTLALVAGFGLVFAAMGKGAQFPCSGWLPRAMEGPTPSSAVFYGGLSVHLGPFLLLRGHGLITATPVLMILTVGIGLLTALHGYGVSRVQTDIKSFLAYGSVTQVGLIVAEIGCGLETLPLLHIIGHAGYRTLQFLRAPSLLHDRHHLEQMLGHHVNPPDSSAGKANAPHANPLAYRRALARGGLDAWLVEQLAATLIRSVTRLDEAERRLTSWLIRPLLSLVSRGGNHAS